MALLSLYLNVLFGLIISWTLTKGVKGTIQTSLEFTVEPRDSVAERKEPFVFHCMAVTDGSSESVNITWRKEDGTDLSDPKKYSVEKNGSLLIHQVKRQRDEGFYECLAHDRYGTIVSRPAQLTIANIIDVGGEDDLEISRSSGESITVAASEGEVVLLKCRLEAEPHPLYTWNKNGEQLPQDNKCTIFQSSGALEIQGVEAADAGKYTCTASIGAKNRQSKAVELIVESSPSGDSNVQLQTPIQQDLRRKTHESALLECTASGLPAPTIEWRNAGGQIVSGDRYERVGQGSLLIHNLTLGDDGVYNCTVTPGDASGTVLTGQITLRVIDPPRVTSLKEPPENSNRLKKIICTVSGTPTANITWLRNGSVVEEALGHIEIRPRNELTISKAVSEDSGYYQCRAQNEGGMDQKTVRITVHPFRNSPGRPTGLRATAPGQDSGKDPSRVIHLAWDPPEGGSEVIAYSVHYIEKNGDGSELQKVSQVSQVEIDQLEPFRNYTFYVVAYSSINGASGHSEKLTQRTDESTPATAPDVTLTPLGTTALKVNWEPLPLHDANGIITEYKLYYRPQGSADSEPGRSVILPPNRTEYMLLNLNSDIRYEVRMLACTSKGYPHLHDEFWPWIQQETSGAVNPGVPSRVDFEYESNATAVHVTWDPGRDEDEILGYKFLYHKARDPLHIMVLPADQIEYVLPNLEPNTRYEISLLATNAAGDGEPISKNVQTSGTGQELDPSPTAPINVVVSATSSTEVTLLWGRPPDFPPGLITSYNIRYRKVGNGGLQYITIDESNIDYIEENEMEYRITDLDPYSVYRFAVRASSSDQNGPYSEDVQCNTPEGVPSPPRNVHFTVVSEDSVDLTWQPPEHHNGIIINYVIQYTSEKDIEEPFWEQQMNNGNVTYAHVEGLTPNEKCYFKIQAATKVGFGQPTHLIEVPVNYITPDNRLGGDDERLGLIVGIPIATFIFALIIIFIIVILVRTRCYSPRELPNDVHSTTPRYNGNGYIPTANGRGSYLPRDTHGMATHEMDSFMPMLTPIHENENSDAKGSYSRALSPSPHVNGLIPINRVIVSYKQANGQVTTALHDNSSEEDGPQVPLRSTSLKESGGHNTGCEEDRGGGGEDEGGGNYIPRAWSLEGIDYSDEESKCTEDSQRPKSDSNPPHRDFGVQHRPHSTGRPDSSGAPAGRVSHSAVRPSDRRSQPTIPSVGNSRVGGTALPQTQNIPPPHPRCHASSEVPVMGSAEKSGAAGRCTDSDRSMNSAHASIHEPSAFGGVSSSASAAPSSSWSQGTPAGPSSSSPPPHHRQYSMQQQPQPQQQQAGSHAQQPPHPSRHNHHARHHHKQPTSQDTVPAAAEMADSSLPTSYHQVL